VRNPRERRADLRAQRAANERAEARLESLFNEHGRETVLEGFDAVIDYSRERVEREIAALPDGTYEATDVLEGDGVTDEDIEISVAVTVDGERIDVDFSGTDDQLAGNLNAPLAVAKSAVYFVVRCLTDPEIPPNHGCYEPVEISAPERSLLDPEPPAAVVGGNVETSQRVTDAVHRARAGRTGPRAGTGSGHHEQPHYRRAGRLRHLLRDDRRRLRRASGPRRDGRRPGRHDQHAQHARRGPRDRVPLSGSSATRSGRKAAVADDIEEGKDSSARSPSRSTRRCRY